MPAKRLTHRQKRQVSQLDPELVKAWREAQASAPEGAKLQVAVVPAPPSIAPLTLVARGDDVRPDEVSPESLVFGECTIKM